MNLYNYCVMNEYEFSYLCAYEYMIKFTADKRII